ncbi:MAG: S41 family peptidase [Chitinophagaceae bacterium]
MKLFLYIFLSASLSACGISRSSFSPAKKYSPEELQKDYSVYESLLKEHHPGLYWYTSRDSMDHYFTEGREQLKDSLTEPQFRKVLTYVAAKINCGHTSVRSSKAWNKYSDTVKLGKLFPLSMKIWEDTVVVTTNLNRRDSILKRGTIITAINGKSCASLVDTLFNYISTDGYNRTHKFQSLSNRGFFGSVYTSLFGLSEKYTIDYKDSNGQNKTVVIPVYNPAADTADRKGTRPLRPATQPSKQEIREQRLSAIRLLRIDTVNHSAMMDLASFGRGYGLRKFFKNSFSALQKNGITHLIIDVRSNGGGSVTNSTILTRYLANRSFKISDSLYAVKKRSPYQRYIQNHFWNKLFISLFTKKKKDGNYHFGYFERHYFKPKKGSHYDGKVYILTGGNSFSATTLFTSALIKQENVTVVGEETGGGAYGNSAWLIPDVTLPETGVRFRLPLFRLVIDASAPKNGKGVQPEVFSLPTVEAIRRNADFKAEKAMELIKKDKQ